MPKASLHMAEFLTTKAVRGTIVSKGSDGSARRKHIYTRQERARHGLCCGDLLGGQDIFQQGGGKTMSDQRRRGVAEVTLTNVVHATDKPSAYVGLDMSKSSL